MSNHEKQSNNSKLPRIGISIGDFNGIGLEVIMKTFMDARMLEICTPFVYCSSKVMAFHKKALGLTDFNFHTHKSSAEASNHHFNLITSWEEDSFVELGKSTPVAGKFALRSLNAALEDLEAGRTDAIVTAPLNKSNVQSDEFKFPGHTEYLAQRFKMKDNLMFMVAGDLRLGLVTGHIPIAEVSSKLTEDLIVDKLRMIKKSLLEDFGIRGPKIAVLGLNPHAGDDGLLGKEEKTVIIPAIQRAFGTGTLAFGPFSSDGFFGAGSYKKFDAVLAMYHDQGLTPFKSIAFDSGVNYTAGMPYVRTSPDHGTAYDIAGKNVASESSFREAVYLACDIVRERRQFAEMTENPLKITKLKREYGT